MEKRIPTGAPKNSRCLITGACGFIGSHLAATLAAAGNEVACLVRSTSRRDIL
ncbi:MAG: GDP-mannose 4,6-dehydratase, partial [Candidatus Aminicenantes bacterium]|nr:GDP-mannose 4,6-dehydratase [Candidatus Aminicenantes bacterium]